MRLRRRFAVTGLEREAGAAHKASRLITACEHTDCCCFHGFAAHNLFSLSQSPAAEKQRKAKSSQFCAAEALRDNASPEEVEDAAGLPQHQGICRQADGRAPADGCETGERKDYHDYTKVKKFRTWGRDRQKTHHNQSRHIGYVISPCFAAGRASIGIVRPPLRRR